MDDEEDERCLDGDLDRERDSACGLRLDREEEEEDTAGGDGEDSSSEPSIEAAHRVVRGGEGDGDGDLGEAMVAVGCGGESTRSSFAADCGLRCGCGSLDGFLDLVEVCFLADEVL